MWLFLKELYVGSCFSDIFLCNSPFRKYICWVIIWRVCLKNSFLKCALNLFTKKSQFVMNICLYPDELESYLTYSYYILGRVSSKKFRIFRDKNLFVNNFSFFRISFTREKMRKCLLFTWNFALYCVLRKFCKKKRKVCKKNIIAKMSLWKIRQFC